MKKYNPKTVESKWQKTWEQKKVFHSENNSRKKKKYVLFEFPYPSGKGLHVGHVRPYIATDVYSRLMRLKGFETLYPMGWDAFGLPAENFAIKNGIHPSITTKKNIANAKKQMISWGLSLDWSREVNTTDPSYYKWTQWIFLQLFKSGLAYEATGPINWCPKDKTGLANEEVIDGKCERCGTVVEKREMRQWYLKITAYAEKLLEGLKHLPEWPNSVKVQQENWIGRSEGVVYKQKIKDSDLFIGAYDSVPQTFMAQTFAVIAPEHPLVAKMVAGTKYESEVLEFVEKIKKKKSENRFELDKSIEGIFTGRYIENPFGTGDLPIWVASFVVMDYGTGFVNCSAHDERDFAFAKKYGIPLRPVMFPADKMEAEKVKNLEDCYHHADDGVLELPTEFKGRKWAEVRQDIINYIEKQGFGKRSVQYKLRDWLFSRQRYWGEPIPIVHCAVCADRMKNKELRIKKKANNSPAEVYFSDQKIWAEILRGYKTVETRSIGSDPEWEKIKAGDTIILFNKKSKVRVAANVEEVRHFKNLLELYKNSDWLEQVFPGQKFKSPVQLELAYKKIYKGYPNQIDRFGLRAWKIKLETVPVAVSEKDLPLKLPPVKKYEPTGTGESPLAQVEKWVNTTCPECKSPARRETNTMPQWAGSSWYWLRYTDPKNKKEFASKAALKYWTPVDVYFGGMEHTTLHLLYSRFWNLFLYDKKLVTTKEPYAKRVPHGIILGPDGDKMSKSKGNVVNPDDIVKKYGADTLRMFEMFLGPHEAQVAWNDQGVIGVRRFLDRVWTWASEIMSAAKDRRAASDEEVERALQKLIKKIGEGIESFRFNTCVSSYMEFLNAVKEKPVTLEQLERFLVVLSPFAPHVAEEINSLLGHKTLVVQNAWPKVNEKLLVEEVVELVVQVNGKIKERLSVSPDISEAEAVKMSMESAKVKDAISGATIKRTIYVPGRLLNIVV